MPAFARQETIAERYVVEHLLGEGGMARVWKVRHRVTGRALAMKCLRESLNVRPDMRVRFLREARAASTVVHPNVVEIYDVFELDDGTPVMVMPLLEGETLRRRLTRMKKLDLAPACDVLLPVVSAVGTAHALGIVHRDLKPDNVFLAQEHGKTQVKVLDFGIAKLLGTEASADPTTGTGMTLGTPCYMAPEQGFGEKDLDHRVDLWALGAMLYEVLSGQRPIRGDNLGQVLLQLLEKGITPINDLVSDLPKDISELIGRLLSRDRERRPRDLREVYTALSRYARVTAPAFSEARPISSVLATNETKRVESRDTPDRSSNRLAARSETADGLASAVLSPGADPRPGPNALVTDSAGPHSVPARAHPARTLKSAGLAGALLFSLAVGAWWAWPRKDVELVPPGSASVAPSPKAPGSTHSKNDTSPLHTPMPAVSLSHEPAQSPSETIERAKPQREGAVRSKPIRRHRTDPKKTDTIPRAKKPPPEPEARDEAVERATATPSAASSETAQHGLYEQPPF